MAESFAAKVKRPDKEDSIRIELMAEAPQRQERSEARSEERSEVRMDERSEQRSHAPRRERSEGERREHQGDRPRDAGGFKSRDKAHGERRPKFDDAPSFGKKKKHKNKPGHAEPAVTPWPLKGAPGKKKAKKKHRG